MVDMKERTITKFLGNLLKSYRKMVFLSGPRQVGKTTLVESYIAENGGGVYFNWDVITDQKRLAKNPYFFEDEMRTPNNFVVLDEIHKYARWKNYLKGAFDKYKDDFLFIVTGSGRLDLFKKGGDSLMGRYISLPIFPFTANETANTFSTYGDLKYRLLHDIPSPKFARSDYDTLFMFSGFPDPLLKADRAYYNIWRQERRELLIRKDIRDASNIREISQLEILSHLIVERVGGPLSINSLREDVGVAFETARDWIELLSNFYYLFLLKPFTGSLRTAIKKERKAYLFDWTEIEDESVKFENFIALHLLKAVKTWRSVGEGDLHLRYIRDKEKREVDFVIVEGKKPVCLIEAKIGEKDVSPALLYMQEKMNVPFAVQILHKGGIEKKLRRNDKIQWVVSADKWLAVLP